MMLAHSDTAYLRRCYRVAFSMLRGINPVSARAILQRVHTEEEFFTMPQSQLQVVMETKSPLFDRQYRDNLLLRAENELTFNDSNRIRELYFTDDNYPHMLQECSDAPVLIYALGDCDYNNSHVVSIVGTRHATGYGVNFVNNLVTDLAGKIDNLIIVSGLAYGIDIAAHRAAVNAGVATIGVVAHGLSTIYPSGHRNDAARMIKAGGMLLSEYPHDAAIHKGNFLARNRIVAGIAECVVVAESAAKGGALVTARIASEYSRDVFALPGRTSDLYSQGCNGLIARNVAHLVSGADDMIEVMGWETKTADGAQQSLFPELSSEEAMVVDYLREKGDARLNNISVDTGLPIPRLMPVMVNLEFKGVVITFPGGSYRLS